MGAAQKQGRGDGSGDQRCGGLGQGAVGEIAHQPVVGVVEGERRGGEREGETGRRAGGQGEGKPGQQQGRGIRPPAGQRDQQRQCAQRTCSTAGGKQQRLG